MNKRETRVEKIEKAARYIIENKCSMEMAAEKFGYSKNSLTDMFCNFQHVPHLKDLIIEARKISKVYNIMNNN